MNCTCRTNIRRISEYLAKHPSGQISYDNIAADLEIDSRTVIRLICLMRHQGVIIVERGRGCIPNRYQINAQAHARIDPDRTHLWDDQLDLRAAS